MVYDKKFSETKNKKNSSYTNTRQQNQCKQGRAFAESVERHFGIECDNFDDTNLKEINKFLEANPDIFTPLDSTNDGIHDKDDNHPLVADLTQRNSSTLSNLI